MRKQHAQATIASPTRGTLDVFWNDPSIDPGCTKLDNVVLQLHRCGATVETLTAVACFVRDNLQALLTANRC